VRLLRRRRASRRLRRDPRAAPGGRSSSTPSYDASRSSPTAGRPTLDPGPPGGRARGRRGRRPLASSPGPDGYMLVSLRRGGERRARERIVASWPRSTDRAAACRSGQRQDALRGEKRAAPRTSRRSSAPLRPLQGRRMILLRRSGHQPGGRRSSSGPGVMGLEMTVYGPNTPFTAPLGNWARIRGPVAGIIASLGTAGEILFRLL